MKLYIANVSQQIHTVNYRLPENPKALSQPIGAGAQILVANRELTDKEIDSVIDQLSRYGLIGVEDVKNSRKQFPWVYSVGKPVPADIMRLAVFRNIGVLSEKGQKARMAAAIATNNAIDNMADAENLPAVQALSMSVEEEKPGDIERAEGEKPIAEGVRMDLTDGGKGNKGRGSSKTRRAA